MPAWPMRQLPNTWLTWPPAWTMRWRSSSLSAVWSLLNDTAAPCNAHVLPCSCAEVRKDSLKIPHQREVAV